MKPSKRRASARAFGATGVLRGALTGGLLLVALGSTACSDEPIRLDNGDYRVDAKVFASELCGLTRPYSSEMVAVGLGTNGQYIHLWVSLHELKRIARECREGRYKTAPGPSVIGRQP